MANLLENYGLEFLSEDEKTYSGFVSYLIREGKPIMGYYGAPYLFTPVGDAEFWVKTEENEDGNYSVAGIDAHCCGNNCLELVYTGIDITPENVSKMGKTVMFSNANGKGSLLPVEVINADVLPGLLEGDNVKLQVVAHPLKIDYYADEDEFTEAQPEAEDGKKYMPADGTLLAMRFLYNHSPERYEKGKNYDSDSYAEFKAKVKHLYHGVFELDGQKHNTFIRCIAETEYGELDFIHTYEQVPEELRKNMKPGAVIHGICLLSGDAAINEYEKGLIKDFPHDLQALRYSFVKGEAERLRCILTKDTVYDTDTTGQTFSGADAIIEKMNYVHEYAEKEYFAHLATITEAEGLDYPAGTRCIVLATEEENNYSSIAFITVNDEGMTERIKISTDSRYRFRVDTPKKEPSPLDDIKIPDSVFEPIISRAKFHGFIEDEAEPEEIINTISDYDMLEDNARRMLDALNENPQPDVEKALENVFGYLFAKVMEQTINTEKEDCKQKGGYTAFYYPAEAFAGKISSSFSDEEHAGLEKAMKLGKQFYNDFRFYMQMKEDDFIDTFIKAAVVVQRIGQLSIKSFFSEEGR